MVANTIPTDRATVMIAMIAMCLLQKFFANAVLSAELFIVWGANKRRAKITFDDLSFP